MRKPLVYAAVLLLTFAAASPVFALGDARDLGRPAQRRLSTRIVVILTLNSSATLLIR